MNLLQELNDMNKVDEPCCYEEVFISSDGELLSEAAIRQFKKSGTRMIRKYRCMSGPRMGKLVSEPSKCGQRKDPRKVRKGKQIMRSKKGVIARKTKIAKKRAMSKLITKMNRRLAHK
jgi:hypothetical protein